MVGVKVQLLLVALFLALAVSACSGGYIMRAAYEQSRILLARRTIDSVLKDHETPLDQREKLEVVLQARAFAQEIGLDPGGSFTKYSKVNRDPLAWVVVGSRRDAFALRLWWFPIVGSVPYKGFFDKEDAQAEASHLEAEGFETWVRGTEAFSTLGWFNDPVLSTTLKSPVTRIVNTVVHESVHSTVWIKNNVPFNESLANFIGTEGTLGFFKARADACQGSDESCKHPRERLTVAANDRVLQYDLSTLIESLYAALEKLYNDPAISSEEKIRRRSEVFEGAMQPFRQRYPKLSILKEVNNAEIVQLKLYLSNLLVFHQLFTKEGQSWSRFLARIREISRAVDTDSSRDPFTLLKEMAA